MRLAAGGDRMGARRAAAWGSSMPSGEEPAAGRRRRGHRSGKRTVWERRGGYFAEHNTHSIECMTTEKSAHRARKWHKQPVLSPFAPPLLSPLPFSIFFHPLAKKVTGLAAVLAEECNRESILAATTATYAGLCSATLCCAVPCCAVRCSSGRVSWQPSLSHSQVSVSCPTGWSCGHRGQAGEEKASATAA